MPRLPLSTSFSTQLDRHKFEFMFVGLVTVLVGAPLVREFLPSVAGVLVPLGYGVAVAFTTVALSRARTWRALGFTLALLIAAGDFADRMIDTNLLRIEFLALSLGFFTVAIALSLREVLFIGAAVDWNRIVGALCVYMMMGLTFSFVYWGLELFSPGSFAGVSEPGASALAQELTYYSFVTLTTLGYGDIRPVTDFAQSLAYMEAVLGQLYLTVLVAGLVGVHISTSRSRGTHGGGDSGSAPG